MKKIFVILAILGISMWGVSELNAALSPQVIAPPADKCARATEPCEEGSEILKVVCKNGGAGTTCNSLIRECPYDYDNSMCITPIEE